MTRLHLPLAVATLLCAAGFSVAQDKPASGADSARKRVAIERDLSLAKEKRARAMIDMDDQNADNAAALEKARTEASLSEARLKLFDEREAPARIAKARLELQGARDSLDDAQEELAQLQMMYKDSEIADKTKDMVLARGKRALARSEARLQQQEEDLKTVETRTLPLERARLEADVAERKRDLERTKRGGEKATFDKRMAERAAANEVTKLTEDLAAAESGK